MPEITGCREGGGFCGKGGMEAGEGGKEGPSYFQFSTEHIYSSRSLNLSLDLQPVLSGLGLVAQAAANLACWLRAREPSCEFTNLISLTEGESPPPPTPPPQLPVTSTEW